MAGLSRASTHDGAGDVLRREVHLVSRSNPRDPLHRFGYGERGEGCRLLDGGHRIEERLVQRRRDAEKSARLRRVVGEPVQRVRRKDDDITRRASNQVFRAVDDTEKLDSAGGDVEGFGGNGAVIVEEVAWS